MSREQVRHATSEENLGAELMKELSREMVQDIHDGRIKNYHDLQEEGLPDERDPETDLAISPLEQLDSPVDEEMPVIEETVDGGQLDERGPYQPRENDEEAIPDEPMDILDRLIQENEDAVHNSMAEDQGDATSTAAPPSVDAVPHSAVPESSALCTMAPTPNVSRRASLRVDEAEDGRMTFGPVRQSTRESTPRRTTMPYPWSEPAGLSFPGISPQSL